MLWGRHTYGGLKSAKNGDFLAKYGQNQSQFLSWAHRAASVPSSVISKEILWCLFSFLSYCTTAVDIGTELLSHGVFNKNIVHFWRFFSKKLTGNRWSCLEIVFLCLRDVLALRSLDWVDDYDQTNVFFGHFFQKKAFFGIEKYIGIMLGMCMYVHTCNSISMG